MDILEIGKICRDKGLYDKATTLCAFSNGQIFVNGDLSYLQDLAKREGLEFFILKGELPIKPNDTTRTTKDSD